MSVAGKKRGSPSRSRDGVKLHGPFKRSKRTLFSGSQDRRRPFAVKGGGLGRISTKGSEERRCSGRTKNRGKHLRKAGGSNNSSHPKEKPTTTTSGRILGGGRRSRGAARGSAKRADVVGPTNAIGTKEDLARKRRNGGLTGSSAESRQKKKNAPNSKEGTRRKTSLSYSNKRGLGGVGDCRGNLKRANLKEKSIHLGGNTGKPNKKKNKADRTIRKGA